MKATPTVLLVVACCLIILGSGGATCREAKRTPIAITPAMEEAWGQEALRKFERDHPESDDVDLAIRISRVGRSVAAVSDRPDHPFRFYLIEGGELQAYSFPGRTVCVTEALARHLERDDELAFALGHELAHITLRHHIYQLRMQDAIDRGSEGWQAMLDTVKGLFDRDSEFEADRFGVLYAVRAGYAYSASIDALRSIGRSTHGGQEDGSHPGFADRAAEIERFEEELQRALEAFRRGVSAHRRGDFEQAIDLYHVFQAEFSNSVWGLINLGGAQLSLVHRQSGSPGGLEVVLLPIISEPGISLRAPLDLDALAEAEDYFSQALQIRPGEALAEAGLGLVEIRRRDFDNARAHFERARKSRPGNPDFLLGLGNVEYMDRNYESAVGWYEKALQRKPNWPEAQSNLELARLMLARASNP